MKASVMDLRYRTKEILRVIDAGEEVVLTHRGIRKAKIVPLKDNRQAAVSLAGHEAVGMWADSTESVPDMITRLRKPRHVD